MASVNHGQFSFDGWTFNVTSSEGHIHRRASHAELRAVFDTSMPDRSNKPDYPVHWYEAQLLHYGLPPSKKRATAKMRLLDALQDGTLNVPQVILKVEVDLKKEWEKQDFEARLRASGIQGSVDAGFKISTTQTESVTMRPASTEGAPGRQLGTPFCSGSVGHARMSSSTLSQRKRASDSSDRTKSKKSKTEQPATQDGQTAGCCHETTGTSVNLHFNTHINNNSPQEMIALSPTQRPRIRGFGFPKAENLLPLAGYETTPSSQESSYETTASDIPRGPFGIDGADDYEYSYAPSTYSTHSKAQIQGPRLGLINGEYDIFSSDLEDWVEFVPFERFNLALCLDDNKQEVWGEYRFGVLRGIMHMDQRPMEASQQSYPFEWRDRDVTGEGYFGCRNTGWIRFLGDGEIEGEMDFYGWTKFQGQRVNGQDVRRPRDSYHLKQEWNKLGGFW